MPATLVPEKSVVVVTPEEMSLLSEHGLLVERVSQCSNGLEYPTEHVLYKMIQDADMKDRKNLDPLPGRMWLMPLKEMDFGLLDPWVGVLSVAHVTEAIASPLPVGRDLKNGQKVYRAVDGSLRTEAYVRQMQ